MTNDQIVRLIVYEMDRAEQKHPQWDGKRHGHSIIAEEFQEFQDEIFADNDDKAFTEVIQLAAVCARYIKNHAPESVRAFY